MCQRWTERFGGRCCDGSWKRRRKVTCEKHTRFCRVTPKPKQKFGLPFSFRIDGCEDNRLFGLSFVINERCCALPGVLSSCPFIINKTRCVCIPACICSQKKANQTKQSTNRIFDLSTHSAIKVTLVKKLNPLQKSRE